MLVHVLLCLDSPREREKLERLLHRGPDVVVSTVASGKGLWRRLTREDVDLLIVGRSVLPEATQEFVRSVRSLPEQPEVVVIGPAGDAEDRARLLAAGCLAVLPEGLADGLLGGVVEAFLKRQRSEAITRIRADRPEEQYSLDDFVSDSPAMQVFLSTARKLVAADTSLLVLGETGVGKERLARAIHSEGPRADGPFIAVNCSALAESLLESELFGHEEGAFTGATRSRKGYFELAHRGTLFLDEIGEMPTHLQVKLLRVLEERKIQRVGGERPIDIDVRVMAATHKDLEADMRAGQFRPDLFYRLAVVTLRIPPLRERRADVPKLAHSYLEHFCLHTGRSIGKFSDQAIEVLTRYAWPGNVRELINGVERAVLLCSGPQIEPEHLPHRMTAQARARDGASEAAPDEHAEVVALTPDLLGKTLTDARREVVAAFERRYLDALLSTTNGRIRDAAHRAGISERSLYQQMKRHQLRKEAYKVRRKRSPSASRGRELSASPAE